MDKSQKQKAYEFGKFAEDIATREYIKRDYTILEKRWSPGKSDIDVIARKDDIIVFIEVKARSGKDEAALSAVNAEKRRRIVRMADIYLRKIDGWCEYRFDIVTVTGDQNSYQVEIFENAFLAIDIF